MREDLVISVTHDTSVPGGVGAGRGGPKGGAGTLQRHTTGSGGVGRGGEASRGTYLNFPRIIVNTNQKSCQLCTGG